MRKGYQIKTKNIVYTCTYNWVQVGLYCLVICIFTKQAQERVYCTTINTTTTAAAAYYSAVNNNNFYYSYEKTEEIDTLTP